MQGLSTVSHYQLASRRRDEDELLLHEYSIHSLAFPALRHLSGMLRFLPWHAVLHVWVRAWLQSRYSDEHDRKISIGMNAIASAESTESPSHIRQPARDLVTQASAVTNLRHDR